MRNLFQPGQTILLFDRGGSAALYQRGGAHGQYAQVIAQHEYAPDALPRDQECEPEHWVVRLACATRRATTDQWTATSLGYPKFQGYLVVN